MKILLIVKLKGEEEDLKRILLLKKSETIKRGILKFYIFLKIN
jgi:hypothetical protein